MTRNQFQNFGFGSDLPPIRNEAASFPAGDASSSIVAPPLPGMMVINAGDPLKVLPAKAREKVADLQRRREEITLLSRADFENEQTLRGEVFRHEARITELRRPRGEGGFGLGNDDLRVKTEQAKADQKRNDLARLLAVKEARSSEGRRLGELLRAIEQAIASRPAGTIGRMVETEPPTLKKGETILDGVESRRRRGRELLADLARVRAAPVPSSIVRQRMRQQVADLAARGRPDASRAVEIAEEIEWPRSPERMDIISSAPDVYSYATGNLNDATALVAWLFRDQLVAALDREIDEIADDSAALTADERQKQETVILSDLLASEHEECMLIDLARSQGLPADFRPECDARAVLAIEWVAAPPPEPREGAGEAGVIRHFGS